MPRHRAPLIVLAAILASAVAAAACKPTGMSDAKPAKGKPAAAAPAAGGETAGGEVNDAGGGGGGGGGGGSSGGFLSLEAMRNASDLDELTPAAVEKILNDEGYVYNTAPNDGGSDDDVSCGSDDARITATRSKLTYAVDGDFVACYERLWGGKGTVSVRKARVRVWGELSCEGADISRFDGKRLRDLGSEDPCVEAGGVSRLRSHMLYDLDATFKGEGEVVYQVRIEALIDGTDGQGCRNEAADEIRRTRGCVHASFLSQNGDTRKRLFTQLDADGLEARKGDRYYRKGQLAVRFNAWRGEVIYAGASEAPRYELNSGAGRVSGVFTGATAGGPGLHLMGRSLRR